MTIAKEDLATEIGARSAKSVRPAFVVTVGVGPDAGKSATVEPNAPANVLVGKSAACHLTLGDGQVSRRHASFEVHGEELRLVDLTSTNGTRVNGVRVTEALLQGGETIGLGSTTLLVERRDATADQALSTAVSFGRVIGASTAMRRIYPLCERLAVSSVPVIIEGETGTGKELLAEALHEASPRKDGPFIVLDGSTISPAEIEKQLFGEGGAHPSRGVFEAAHEGTLLIDEVAELPVDVQRKLLRAIDKGEICQVRTDTWIKVNVRVIVTTARDLEKEVEAGRFREDLFFRLAIGRIELPPLRRRSSDVALLADYFWKRLTEELAVDRPLPHDLLRRYDGSSWPGNVRELRNLLTRRLAVGDADDDGAESGAAVENAPEQAFRWVLEQDLPFTSARDLVNADFTRQYVAHVLAQHNGNVSRAAIASGLARRYFQTLRARQK